VLCIGAVPDYLSPVLQFVNLVGLIVLGVWVKRWIKSLQGTVEAQQATISAFQNLLSVVDLPQMQKRFEAYKKIFDHEKELLQQKFDRETAEYKQQLSQTGFEMLKAAQGITRDYMGVIAALIPYVPREVRREAIEKNVADPGIKDALNRIADGAPELPFAHEQHKFTLTLMQALRAPSSPPTLGPLLEMTLSEALGESDKKK